MEISHICNDNSVIISPPPPPIPVFHLGQCHWITTLFKVKVTTNYYMRIVRKLHSLDNNDS